MRRGEKRLTTLQHNAAEAPEGTIPPPIQQREYEIARYSFRNNISLRFLASVPYSEFTQKEYTKLIKHLEIDKEDLPKGDPPNSKPQGKEPDEE